MTQKKQNLQRLGWGWSTKAVSNPLYTTHGTNGLYNSYEVKFPKGLDGPVNRCRLVSGHIQANIIIEVASTSSTDFTYPDRPQLPKLCHLAVDVVGIPTKFNTSNYGYTSWTAPITPNDNGNTCDIIFTPDIADVLSFPVRYNLDELKVALLDGDGALLKADPSTDLTGPGLSQQFLMEFWYEDER